MPFPIQCPNEKCEEYGKEKAKHVVENYSAIWGDGDIHCAICGTYIRMFDRD